LRSNVAAPPFPDTKLETVPPRALCSNFTFSHVIIPPIAGIALALSTSTRWPAWIVVGSKGKFGPGTVRPLKSRELEGTEALGYFSLYFVLTQFALLAVVYAFTRVDWNLLLRERKWKWLPKSTADIKRRS
jgi:hypothetical protein